MTNPVDSFLASISSQTDQSQNDPEKKKKVVNPFDAYLAGLTTKRDAKTNQPIITEETLAQHQARMKPILDRNASVSVNEKANSGLEQQFGQSIVQGAGNVVSGLAGTLSSITDIPKKVEPIMPLTHFVHMGTKAMKNVIDNTLAMVQPTVNPNSPNLSAAAQTGGELMGQLAAQGPVFGASKGIAEPLVKKAGEEIAKSIPHTLEALKSAPLAQKALGTISKVIGDQHAQSLVQSAQSIASTLPTNIASATLGQAAIDPQSLATKQGVAMTGFFGAVGSLMDLRNINPVTIATAPPNINVALNQQLVQSLHGRIRQALPPYAQRIINTLTPTVVPQTPITATTLLGRIANASNRFRTEFVNRTSDLKVEERGQGGHLAPESPADLAELSAGIAERIDKVLHDGPFIFDSANNPVTLGPGLEAILADTHPDDLVHLNSVLVAARTLDERISSPYVSPSSQLLGSGNRTQQGPALPGAASVNIGIDPRDARQLLANADPALVHTAAAISNNLDQVLEYPLSMGMLSQTAANGMRLVSKSYIPLQRMFETEPPVSGMGARTGGFLKELQGSLEKINNPIANAIDYTKRVVRATDQNRVWSKFVDLYDRDPVTFQDVIRPVSDHLASPGNSAILHNAAQNIQATLQAQGHNISLQTALQMASFLQPEYFDAHSNVMTIVRNGQPVRYYVNNTLARYAKAITPQESGLLETLFRGTATLAKQTITKEPIFMMFHGLIDNLTAKTQSEYGYQFGVTWMEGLMEGVRKGQSYYEWKAAGGAGGTLGDAESLSSPYGVRSVIPKTVGQRVATNILHPLDALSEITKPIYTAAKLGEYMNIRRNYSGIDAQTAALAARRVTPDMAQLGGSMKFLAGVAEFSNPAIQHIDNLYQAIRANPTSVFAKGALGITLPTVALWLANLGDEQIDEQRKSPGGSHFWYVRLHEGDDGVVKLKKPYALGHLFATLPEEALDAIFSKDPNTVLQGKHALLDAVRINMIPSVAQTAMGLWANKNWFNDVPIIPTGQELVDPQLQRTNTTSAFAQAVSHGLYSVSLGSVNISPIQLDFIVQRQFGDIGQDITKIGNVLSKAENTGPERGIAGWPVIGKLFANYPTRNTMSLQTFYENSHKVESVMKTLKSLHDVGDINGFNAYIDANQKAISLAPVMTEARLRLAKYGKDLATINSKPDAIFSPREKKELNDQYLHEMTMLAQYVNEGIKTSELLNARIR